MPLLDKKAEKITPELHKKILDYLDQTGIKKVFIAQKLGISRSQFSQIETGKRKIQSGEMIILKKIIGI